MAAPNNREVVPNSLLGMLIFVAAEIMLFLGFISAFTISRAGAPVGTLEPARDGPAHHGDDDQHGGARRERRVSVRGTASASAAHRAGQRTLLARVAPRRDFVLLQGREWWRLLAPGLTLTSSPLGAFFYLIVGRTRSTPWRRSSRWAWPGGRSAAAD